ncbi:MAG: endonuclease/exonuclease/phosphatase family protein [Pyrinomonadaceae bacterium]
MKRLLPASLAFFAIALLFNSHAHTAPLNNNLCGGNPCLQIGSFNIEFLGDTQRTHYWDGKQYKLEPRTQNEVKQIAGMIFQTLGLEVVVLEEIDTGSQRYAWLKESLGQVGYKFLEGTNSENKQFVVVAYKDDEIQLGSWGELEVPNEFSIPVDFQHEPCAAEGQRRPLAATFKAKKGKFDFMLVGVHLKSQRDGDCSHIIRRQQAEDLVAALKVHPWLKKEKDVIIVGDFNAALEDTPPFTTASKGEIGSLRPLTTIGFVDLCAAVHRAPDSSTFSYLPRPYRGVIDHLMVVPKATTEYHKGSTIIHKVPDDKLNPKDHKSYYDIVSDHAPVYASFRIDLDDD